MTVASVNIDWDRGLITDASGTRTALRAQSLAVLKELHDRAGTLVSKDELISKVWSSTSVTDDSLVQCITELRRALRDDAHTIIKTMPKRGYIYDTPHVPTLNGRNGVPYFVSAIETVGSDTKAVEPGVPENSIAVLPFVNLSADAEQDFFVDGLSEDIIMGLSNVAGLFVIGRSSTFAYKGRSADARQVAYDLGVTFVLEGSVRRAGGRLRVNAQLVNGRDGGKVLWTERIDHDMQDVFAAQDQLARQISAKVLDSLAIEGRRPSFKMRNKETYKLCAKSRDIWALSQFHCSLALQNFERALEIAPDDVEAMFQLAVVHCCSWYHLSKPIELHHDKAIQLSDRALELAPQSSAVCTVAAGVHLWSGNHDKGEALISKALALNPNNANAHAIRIDVMTLTGRHAEALESAAVAFRIDPHGPGWFHWELAAALFDAGRYDDAIAVYKRPATYNSISKGWLAAILATVGRMEEAKQEAKHFLALNPDWRTSRDAFKRPYVKAEDRERFVDGFRKAGLPE